MNDWGDFLQAAQHSRYSSQSSTHAPARAARLLRDYSINVLPVAGPQAPHVIRFWLLHSAAKSYHGFIEYLPAGVFLHGLNVLSRFSKQRYVFGQYAYCCSSRRPCWHSLWVRLTLRQPLSPPCLLSTGVLRCPLRHDCFMSVPACHHQRAQDEQLAC